MRPRYSVSIIVLNFDCAKMTADCIESIEKTTSDASVDVVLVDNGSEEEEFRKVNMLASSRVKVVRCQKKMGFGEANNIGVEESAGDYVVFMNNDVVVKPGWLEKMICVFDTELKVGAVGPKMLFPNNELQEAGCVVTGDGVSIQIGRQIGRESVTDLPFDLESTQIVDYCSAACLLMRRADFMKLGGFDPQFEPAYYEDSDLVFRLRSLGHFCYYCGAAEIWHICNATTKRVWNGGELSRLVRQSQQKFLDRWGSYLRGRLVHDIDPEPVATVDWRPEPDETGRSKLVLYRPVSLDVSQLSKWALETAAALGDCFDVTIASDQRHSRLRVYSLCRDWTIPVFKFRVRAIGEVDESKVTVLQFSDEAYSETTDKIREIARGLES
jgi:GT2 family glycosyltransferase